MSTVKEHIEQAESLLAQAATMYDGEDWQREQASLLLQRGQLHIAIAQARKGLVGSV